MSKIILPTWVPNYRQVKAAYQSGKLTKPPRGIVLHSGEIGAGVAEYFQTEDAKKRKVSAHFAWSVLDNDFVQCVALDTRACHVGFFVNRTHLGIEMPGPFDQIRSNDQYAKLVRLLIILKQTCTRDVATPSTFEYSDRLELVAHSFLDKNKRDPGPHFEWQRLIDLGFVCKF